MAMYNLIEYSDNFSKTAAILWQYYKIEPNDTIADSGSFKSKAKITGSTPNKDNKKNVKIILPLSSNMKQYQISSNLWRTLEMPLINCEVNLILTWLSICVITNSTGVGRFAVTDIKLLLEQISIRSKYIYTKQLFKSLS